MKSLFQTRSGEHTDDVRVCDTVAGDTVISIDNIYKFINIIHLRMRSSKIKLKYGF